MQTFDIFELAINCLLMTGIILAFTSLPYRFVPIFWTIFSGPYLVMLKVMCYDVWLIYTFFSFFFYFFWRVKQENIYKKESLIECPKVRRKYIMDAFMKPLFHPIPPTTYLKGLPRGKTQVRRLYPPCSQTLEPTLLNSILSIGISLLLSRLILCLERASNHCPLHQLK